MPRVKLPPKNFEWTPRLAYAVGLLATDGCLSSDGRHIIMRSSEKQMLTTFRDCLEITNKIGININRGNTSYRVQFGSVQFYNWLMQIGLFPAKTYTLGEIQIPEEFFRDFLRGHLDGDGSISFYEDRYNFYKGRDYVANRLYICFISASRPHITWIRRKVSELAGIHGALIEGRPRDANRVSIWKIKFSKKESIKLLRWIYYDPALPTLKRKRLLAERALGTIAHEKRKQYTRITVPV